MNWTPKTEEEVIASQLCPKGKAPFTVLEANTVESKSTKNAGKTMLKLKINVHADDGGDYHIYDYIAPWFMAHKFRHFFFCVGRGADYDAGTVDVRRLVHCEGWAEIGHEKAKEGFGPKAKILDYVVDNAAKANSPAVAPDGATPAPEEDDVPF